MPPPTATSARILFMDDEADIRKVGARVLTYLGYRTTAVNNGEDAIAAYASAQAEGDPFAAVILDLTIHGGLGGAETIQRLREIDPDVKGLVSTGHACGDIANDYQHYGFVDTISKPYEIAALKAVLELVLGHA